MPPEWRLYQQIKIAPGWNRADIDNCEARTWDWLIAIDGLVQQVQRNQENERISKMFNG